MRKVWLLFILLCIQTVLLAQEVVNFQVVEQLANRRIPVNGYFAHYDRNDPLGWVYLSANGHLFAKLEGMDPETGLLRWTLLKNYFESVGYDGNNIVIGPLKDSSIPGTLSKHVVGTVIDSSTRQPLAGVQLLLIDNTVDRVIASAISNSDGQFDLFIQNFNPNHFYTLSIMKDGYKQVVGNFNSDLLGSTDDNYVNYGIISLIPQDSEVLHAVVEGQVIDSTTGASISHASVKLYRGSYITSSSSPVQQTLTDDLGNFSLQDIPSDNYTLVVQKDGYLPNYTNITVDEAHEYIEISLSPNLVEGQHFRIQLSWGENPKDLDSHLLFLKNSQLQYHIYWNLQYAYYDDLHRQYITADSLSSNLEPVAFLDRDDIDSYGPETVTIYQIDQNGVYKYFVHDYSNGYVRNSMALAHSGAQVKVFTNEGVQRIFNVPYEKGNVWKVFEIRNGRIVPCESGCMYDFSSIEGAYSAMPTRALYPNMFRNLLRHMRQKQK